MTNRNHRAKIAQETVSIIEQGRYTSQCGNTVDISNQLRSMCERTIHYTPEELYQLVEKNEKPITTKTNIEVVNETTFEGAKHLLDTNNRKVLSLNFASAKNPGGGFLNGSHAQEEALSRASGLYSSLLKHMDMYLDNREFRSCLYRHHIIYSPDVPVFRSNLDELIDEPWYTSILTAPAVNRGALKEHELDKYEITMRQRIDMVLSIARKHKYQDLVLGAWGCGVFKNKPEEIAEYFRFSLSEQGKFYNAFKNIRFSVLDRARSQVTFNIFKEILAN